MIVQNFANFYQLNDYRNKNFIEQTHILHNITKDIAFIFGIPCPKVFVLNTLSQVKNNLPENSRAIFIPKTNSIYINHYKYKNPYLLLEIIIHEVVHSYLSFLITHKINKKNLKALSFKKYHLFTKLDNNNYLNFLNFSSKFCVSKKYFNILILDKIYNQNNNSQPYFYNLDSSELLAEYISTCFLTTIFQSIEINKYIFNELLKELNYSKNYIDNLKIIYIKENIKNKSPIKVLCKILQSIKFKTNLFVLEFYDIEQYENLWKLYKIEFNKLENMI